MNTLTLVLCIFYTFAEFVSQNDARTSYNISALFDIKSAKELDGEFTFITDKLIKIFDAQRKVIDVTDSFAVSNAICENLENGVYAILGLSDVFASSTIQSYSDTFEVPFVTLSMPQNSSAAEPFQLYMRPHHIDALVQIIVEYNWKSVMYMYDSDEGLIRLQQLFQAHSMLDKDLIDIHVKKIDNGTEGYQKLADIYNTTANVPIHILLDVSVREAEILILKLRNDKQINLDRFHFLLGFLGINDMDGETLKMGMNITGFELVNKTNRQLDDLIAARKLYSGIKGEITLEKALMFDAVQIVHKALKKWHKKESGRRVPQLADKNCRLGEAKVKYKPGIEFLKFLRDLKLEGFTGNVEFDSRGMRKNYKLALMESAFKSEMKQVGSYQRETGLTRTKIENYPGPPRKGEREIDNKTRMVTTVLDPPYVMKKDEYYPGKCGKKNFEGFCIDLAEKIANILNFTYEICLVKDDRYGEKLENGTWNGMIGELYRKEADLAIAPMTISSERERVVDFTKPFMSLGISIMIKKPSNSKAHVFSFMDPLSYEIWMCILFAYVGVSVVLFLVSRFSPSEWHVEEDSNITNDFTISNSLWYSLGAFMQQGCDISPKAISGRIVGSVWWFFTLIIISSYTANLAAFLTVERMNTPIESAEDLAKQTNIQYGVLNSGTTKHFFQNSKVAIYERMWAYMSSADPSVFVDSNQEGIAKVRESNGKYAYLVESTINEYRNMKKPCDTMKVGANLDSKGYGIATPVDSDLRDHLTLTVLQLRESGELQELKKKWWDDRSDCDFESGAASDTGQAALSLSNVAGIFYILISGLTLAIFIAGCEFLYKSVMDSRKSKTSFGSMIRCKARLSFRGSIDKDSSDSATVPIRKTLSTYTYTGPTQLPGFDPYPDTNNTHTQV